MNNPQKFYAFLHKIIRNMRPMYKLKKIYFPKDNIFKIRLGIDKLK